MLKRLGLLVGICTALLISQANGQLTGWLSNFDAHNYLEEPVDNLELDFFGEIDTTDILKWYKGANAWGNPPRIRSFPAGTFPDLPAGIEVTWIDRINPIKHCETRHFGLRLNPALKRLGIQAYWTRIKKLEQIPVPWQFWQVEPGVILDIIRLSNTFPAPVYIRRWFAIVDAPVPLNSLNWELEAEWTLADPRPTPIEPGGEVELQIPLLPEARAVLVRYEVSLNDEMEPVNTRFINEAILETESRQIMGTLSNFDAHNFLREPVDNLELDFFGQIDSTDILDWYTGPNDWGNPPRIRGFPAGTFPGLPDGVEVTWMDRINPIKYCETRHFGLSIDPSVPPPGVQAYWTRIEKVEQIPVPWQFWQVLDDCRVRDIIVLSETFEGSVIINREFALAPEVVDLDNLNWEFQADWQPVTDDPSTLRPGDSLVLEIQTSDDDKAVLVRYTVAPVNNPEMILTRFVNEAIKEPCAPPEEDWDFGDAPDPPYPSLLASNGARHLNPPAPDHEHYEWLGDKDTFAVYNKCDRQNPQVDEEFDSHQIDNDSPNDYPGPDDGVVFHFPYEYCKEETVDVLVSTSGAGTSRYGPDRLLYLNAWFDWNCNGGWNDPTEHIVWKSAQVLGPGTQTAEPIDGTPTYKMNPSTWSTPCRLYRFTFHCDAETTQTSWARFRLSYEQNANTPIGSTRWGEVEDWKYSQRVAGIEERGAIPPAFKLSKNLPDPFKATTSIEYALPKKTKVTLSIYNALGEKVMTLVDGEKQAGVYTVDWDGKNDEGERVPVGIYFYRLEVDEYSQTMKMVLLR